MAKCKEFPIMDGDRIAIVGSRHFPNPSLVRAFVLGLPKFCTIVSGGARGVDQWAESAAGELGAHVKVFLPNYEKYSGGLAPLMRNALIVKYCDNLVAFWDGESRGTMHAVSIAKSYGKPTMIVLPDNSRLVE